MTAMGKLLRKLLHVRPSGNARAEMLDAEDQTDSVHEVRSDVPAGFLVVYVGVGEERQRFVIEAKLLKHDALHVLLERSAEEFGYKHDGGLIIACDVAFFQHLLRLIETKSPMHDLRDYWAFAPDNTTCHMVE